jgi:predicted XRE-type DNA-binding protein
MSRWQEVTFTTKHITALERKEFIDGLKQNLCQQIRRAALRDRYTQRELAILLGTSPARVSKVIRSRTDELTIDILFNYLYIIEPRTKVLVAI